MSSTTVGARYQVVIPQKERSKIGLQPHQKLNVVVEGDRIILEPIGKQKIRGIMQELRDDQDAVDYVNKLRQEWDM